MADRQGATVAAANLQSQISNVQQSGGFDSDHTATVAFLGYKAGFSDYTGQDQLSDKEEWYRSKTLYASNKIDDNQYNFYMTAGKTQGKLQKMIDKQYNRE